MIFIDSAVVLVLVVKCLLGLVTKCEPQPGRFPEFMEHNRDIVRLTSIRHADDAEREIWGFQSCFGNNLSAGRALAERCKAPAPRSLAFDRLLLKLSRLCRVSTVRTDVEHLVLFIFPNAERACKFCTKQSHRYPPIPFP